MKIEVGESLLLSWLRHVKGCQIVQTNWKPSLKVWDLYHNEDLDQFMEKAAKFYQTKNG